MDCNEEAIATNSPGGVADDGVTVGVWRVCDGGRDGRGPTLALGRYEDEDKEFRLHHYVGGEFTPQAYRPLETALKPGTETRIAAINTYQVRSMMCPHFSARFDMPRKDSDYAEARQMCPAATSWTRACRWRSPIGPKRRSSPTSK